MIEDFVLPFITIGLAELGDKTQLAVLALSSKTKKYLQLLLGVILAFIIADGLAVLFGKAISNTIPIKYIKIGSGIIFIVFGVITLLKNKKENKEVSIKNPFISGFSLIFISELGDKTQIGTALFAAKYNPVLVFIGIISALTILSITAIYLGKFLTKKLKKSTISTIAGILFIIIGIISFF